MQPSTTAGFTSAIYFENRIYGLNKTGVVCLNATTGEQLWQQRADSPFSASPVVADGKIYAVSEDGKTTVIKLGDKPEILAVNRVEETILATTVGRSTGTLIPFGGSNLPVAISPIRSSMSQAILVRSSSTDPSAVSS